MSSPVEVTRPKKQHRRHSTEVHQNFAAQVPEYRRRQSISVKQPDGVDAGISLSVGLFIPLVMPSRPWPGTNYTSVIGDHRRLYPISSNFDSLGILGWHSHSRRI